jgi:hypothetical protein
VKNCDLPRPSATEDARNSRLYIWQLAGSCQSRSSRQLKQKDGGR